jgi:cold shock protein
MAIGRTKWFNDQKGWGFITTENGVDVFVHYSSILGKGHRKLEEGDRVEFDIVTGDKGLQATKVRVIE